MNNCFLFIGYYNKIVNIDFIRYDKREKGLHDVYFVADYIHSRCLDVLTINKRFNI